MLRLLQLISRDIPYFAGSFWMQIILLALGPALSLLGLGTRYGDKPGDFFR